LIVVVIFFIGCGVVRVFRWLLNRIAERIFEP